MIKRFRIRERLPNAERFPPLVRQPYSAALRQASVALKRRHFILSEHQRDFVSSASAFLSDWLRGGFPSTGAIRAQRRRHSRLPEKSLRRTKPRALATFPVRARFPAHLDCSSACIMAVDKRRLFVGKARRTVAEMMRQHEIFVWADRSRSGGKRQISTTFNRSKELAKLALRTISCIALDA